MRVAHVRISNILGIEEIEFAPGGFTEVSGGNGAGKTSVLEAIRAALRGGNDATLLRNGADRGEIVGGEAAGHHGVDDGVRHDRELCHEHGPREPIDVEGALAIHGQGKKSRPR